MLEQQILLLSRFALMKCFWNMQWLINSRKKVYVLMAVTKTTFDVSTWHCWTETLIEPMILDHSKFAADRPFDQEIKQATTTKAMRTSQINDTYIINRCKFLYCRENNQIQRRVWGTRTTTANFRISTWNWTLSTLHILAEHVFTDDRPRQLRNSKVEYKFIFD